LRAAKLRPSFLCCNESWMPIAGWILAFSQPRPLGLDEVDHLH
jgi:hypothetical protein